MEGTAARVYLAGPDGFTPYGLEWHRQRLMPAVAAAGLVPLSPWDGFGAEFEALASAAPGAERLAAYRELNDRVGRANAELIDSAAAVLAVLDGADVDSGTAAEIGYAAGTGKVVVGLRSDVRPAGDNEGAAVNLQVEYFIRASGGAVCRTIEEAVAALATRLLLHGGER